MTIAENAAKRVFRCEKCARTVGVLIEVCDDTEEISVIRRWCTGCTYENTERCFACGRVVPEEQVSWVDDGTGYECLVCVKSAKE